MRLLGRWWIVLALFVAACSSSSSPSTSPTASSSSTPSLRVTGAARIVSTTAIESRVLVLSVASPAVGANVPVRLILPADFTRRPTVRWPVLYLLHGCCDDSSSWLANTDIVKLSAAWNVLVVIPDGGRAGFYSNWRKGPQWETFHLVELRRLLEQKYRAGSMRAVAGLSMGGLGALGYAARNPGFFRAAASFSGIANTRGTVGDSYSYQDLVAQEGGDPEALWGNPTTDVAIWKAHNPYDLAPRLRGIALFVSAGNGVPGPLDASGAASDPIEDGLGPQNERFVAHLRALRIPVTADLYGPGTHTWPYWQRELHRAWPMLMRAIAATRGT